MRLRSLLCSVFAALSLVVPPLGHADESADALVQLEKNVRLVTLPNGLRVIMYRRGLAPVFTGAVAVRVGGTDEVPGNTGISHLLEHMAFKGTPDVGTNNYAREKVLLAELETLAARSDSNGSVLPADKPRWDEIQAELTALSGTESYTREFEQRGASGMNATTDKELTRYFVNMPRPAFEFWCWAESERLLAPVMRQFYQERDVVMEERRMRFEDEPDGKLYEQMLGVTFLAHPYRNPVIGYAFDIRKLTATMVEEFRRRYYVPGNIVVSIVGDVDPVADLPMIERYFGRLQPAPLPSRPVAVEPPQEGEREIVLRTKAQPQLVVSYHKPQYPHPDDPAISMMLEIIAGGNVAPLYTELVKNQQIAAGIGYDEGPGQAYPNLMSFHASTRAPHTNTRLLAAFDNVIADFKKKGATAEQLEIARRGLAMGYLGGMRSNQSLALDMASSELLHGGWRSLIDWYKLAMAVTTDDVNRVARVYLVPRNRTIGRIEPLTGAGAQEVK